MIVLLNKGLKWFTTLSSVNDEALKKGGISVDFAANARAHEETNENAEHLIYQGMWNETTTLKQIFLIIDLAYA